MNDLGQVRNSDVGMGTCHIRAVVGHLIKPASAQSHKIHMYKRICIYTAKKCDWWVKYCLPQGDPLQNKNCDMQKGTN
jgi:hypothetical protein